MSPAAPAPSDVVAEQPVRPPARRPMHRSARRETLTAWLMSAPAVILLGTFLVAPTILAFILAFTNARLVSPLPPRFIGTDNFVRAFTQDPVFPRAIGNTFYFAGMVVPVHSALALVLALLVNTRLRGRNVFRAIYFLPVVASSVAVSVLWKFLYQPDGLVNSMIFTMSGATLSGIDWLGETGTAMPAVMLMSVWAAVGFHMIVLLAGLQTIPPELYEAASIDGANRWQQFWNVTWPGLQPTLVLVVVTETIGALGVFAQINIMTDGGPLDSTATIVFHAVRMAYRQQYLGYASALSLVFFLIVLAISLIQRLWLQRGDR